MNLLENVWMKGDEDGVLCEDSKGNPFAVIMFSPGLLKFKSLISETNISEEFSQLIGRTILSTIALLVEYISSAVYLPITSLTVDLKTGLTNLLKKSNW